MRTILKTPSSTQSTPCVPVIHADTQGPQIPWYDWVGQKLDGPPGPFWTGREAPRGVGRLTPIALGPSNFSTKNVTTRINRYPPQSSDVSHNSNEVGIGVYG